MGNGTTSVGTTSTEIVPQTNPGNPRRKIVITNISDELIMVCQSIAATSQGVGLDPGGIFIDQPDSQGYIFQGRWAAICGSGSKNLSWYEEFYK